MEMGRVPSPLPAVKRLARMEFDVRPHEPVAISGIFIAVMLVVTVLIFALA